MKKLYYHPQSNEIYEFRYIGDWPSLHHPLYGGCFTSMEQIYYNLIYIGDL